METDIYVQQLQCGLNLVHSLLAAQSPGYAGLCAARSECARLYILLWYLNDTIPYKLHDLLPRKGKYMCEQCSNICQQPKFHAEVSECPRQVLPVDMNRNRAMGIEPDPCRISGPQLETKKRKKQCETKKSSSMQDESLQENFPFKHPFCKKLKYKTAVNANKHMEAKHAELKLELYPVGTRTKRRKNRTSPPKATVVKAKSVPGEACVATSKSIVERQLESALRDSKADTIKKKRTATTQLSGSCQLDLLHILPRHKVTYLQAVKATKARI